jgi:hypothetical protein
VVHSVRSGFDLHSLKEKPVLYYHGTTKRRAEAIQREGLVPHREYVYDMSAHDMLSMFFGIENERRRWKDYPSEQEPFVYVTKDKLAATGYAVFRAEYEMASKGDKLVHPTYGSEFIKFGDSCKCKEEPVVIAFDIPLALASAFEGDNSDYNGYVCRCTVEPKYIKAIEPATL